jgi:hypothetical protein
MTNSEIRVLELPSFIDDDKQGWAFDTLKTLLATSIRAMHPLFPQYLSQFRSGSNFSINSSDPQHLSNMILSDCDSATRDYSQLILENFTESATRLAIAQDEDLSHKIFSLLLGVPFHNWTHPTTFEEDLRNLRPVVWHLPEEWEDWKGAIESLRLEGSYRIRNYAIRQMQECNATAVVGSNKTSGGQTRKWESEPFIEAGVKFGERDEHIWWTWPSEEISGSSDGTDSDDPFIEHPLGPDDNVTERSQGLAVAVNIEETLVDDAEKEEGPSV